MTNPSDALQSFQEELLQGRIRPQPCLGDPNLFIYSDKPLGSPRVTYARLKGATVTALVMFVFDDPIEGIPCFGIGYAVPEAYRNEGRAKEVVKAAIADLRDGLARGGRAVFYVEAIVGVDNRASQRVAEQVISDSPVAVTDKLSGLPALQYVCKIEKARSRKGHAKRPKP